MADLYLVSYEVTDGNGEPVQSGGLKVECDDLAYLGDRIGEMFLETSVDNVVYESEEEKQAHLRMARGTCTEDDLKYLKPPED